MVAMVSRLGIFVGGAGTRMGGVAKGLLRTKESGEALAARLVGIAHTLGLRPVLVGRAEAYAELLPDVPVLADEPVGIGPLGGLNALLRAYPTQRVMAVACDMPRVSALLLRRLAADPSQAAVLAPRNGEGLWEPLCARYDAPQVLPELARALDQGVRSFQRLFAQLAVEELKIADDAQHELVDWDTPEDVDTH
jgi:molybdopterin-guanine dinucleotide biosynthesis protein A